MIKHYSEIKNLIVVLETNKYNNILIFVDIAN